MMINGSDYDDNDNNNHNYKTNSENPKCKAS